VDITQEQIGTVVNLLQIGSWIGAELDGQLRARAGISHAEYEVLMQLRQHGSRLSMKELSELSLFTQSGMTRVVDRLVRKGLVTREIPTDNRRAIYALLTNPGKDKLEKVAMPLVRHMMADRFSRRLPTEDMDLLAEILLTLLRTNGWWDERQVSHRGAPRGDRAAQQSRRAAAG
jgi:DNA-binding MarR family transcriptional regulator